MTSAQIFILFVLPLIIAVLGIGVAAVATRKDRRLNH